MTEPNPCIDCGSRADVLSWRKGDEDSPQYEQWEHHVSCSECDLCGPTRDTEQEATAAWNRLVMMPEGWRGRIEEAAKMLDVFLDGGSPREARRSIDSATMPHRLRFLLGKGGG